MTFGDFSRNVVSKSSRAFAARRNQSDAARKARERALAHWVEEAFGLQPLAQRFDLRGDCADAEQRDLDDAKLILAAAFPDPDRARRDARQSPSRSAGSFRASFAIGEAPQDRAGRSFRLKKILPFACGLPSRRSRRRSRCAAAPDALRAIAQPVGELRNGELENRCRFFEEPHRRSPVGAARRRCRREGDSVGRRRNRRRRRRVAWRARSAAAKRRRRRLRRVLLGVVGVDRTSATRLRLGSLQIVFVAAAAAGDLCDFIGWESESRAAACPASAAFMKRAQMRAGMFPPYDSIHRRVVVVAEPNRGDEIGREADEPRIAKIRGRAGLSGRRAADDGVGIAGAVRDDVFAASTS